MSRATQAAGIYGRDGKIDIIRYNIASVTAAGSNSQANSTLLTNSVTVVTTLSGVTTRGVRLPNFPQPGTRVQVINATTTNMKVYPGTSGKLALAATINANVSLAALKSKAWLATTDRQWVLSDTLA